MCDHEERAIEDPYDDWKASNYRDLAETFAEEHQDAFDEYCKACYESEQLYDKEQQQEDEQRM
jgi:hypothetical protein